MAIASWKLIPALMCGNTVVLKPATDTPLSAINLVKVCEEAGVPAGVVNLVTGSGRAVGVPLMQHPSVRIVSFTGSTEIGREVNQACASRFKRVSLEMGGKNVQIVLADADLDLAVDGALWGASAPPATLHGDLAAGRRAAHRAEFTRRLVEAARRLKVGPAWIRPPRWGRSSTAASATGSSPTSTSARKRGQAAHRRQRARDRRAAPRGIHGAHRVRRGDAEHAARPRGDLRAGPEPVDRRLVRGGRGGGQRRGVRLSASIYTRDVNRAFLAMRELETGIVTVNAPTIGAEVQLPFGGTADWQRPPRAGVQVLDLYTEWKSIYVDFSGRLQRAQIDTGEGQGQTAR